MTIDHTADGGTGDPSTRPYIYVASLSDYNAGRLHGVWIDASRSAEEITVEVEAMLKASPSPDAEEWAIHDYEGFGPIRLSEWESFDRVSALAEMIAAHGEAFAAWFADADVDSTDDLEEAFSDAYQGEFTSLADYAQSFAEETGVLQQYPVHDYSMFQQPDDLSRVWPFSCIDWDRAGNELVAGGDVWTAASVSGVFVFRSYSMVEDRQKSAVLARFARSAGPEWDRVGYGRGQGAGDVSRNALRGQEAVPGAALPARLRLG